MCCSNKNNCCKSKASVEQDYLVCTCMGVMKSEIQQAIERGLITFEQLSDELGVGTGCESCVQEICQMLDKYKKCC